MKKILLLVIILSYTSIQAQTSAQDMVVQMGRGINLGNVFSAPIEGNWSPVVYQQYFTDLASAGFTNVRIPIDFLSTSRTTGDTSIYSAVAGTSASYTGSSADYVINSTFLDRIETVVTWGLDAGLVVIVDFHGGDLKADFIKTFDSGESAYTDPTSARRAADNEKFRTVWAAVAERFKAYSYNLLFEVINEPYFHMSESDMNTLNTDIIPIIRNTGSNNAARNIIITGGTNTSHEAPLAIDSDLLANNSYLIPTFHYYQPFKFTSSTKNANPDTDWGSAADKATLDADFLEVKNWATANSVPIFVGEFSADNTFGYDYSTGDLKAISNATSNPTGFANAGPDNASRVEFHRYIAEQAISLGFSFAAWDSGPSSNKTIHMRRDNPSTVNYDINNFSVVTYNPKNTNISTTPDTSTWVEDVKDALLDTTTSCDNSTPNLIVNKNFECGYNDSWDIFIPATSSASATFSDATTDARTGNVGAKIDVTSADALNKVILRNVEYTEDLTGKVIKISIFAKASTLNQDIKIRLKALVDGTNNFPASQTYTLTTSYPATPYELEYTILPNTTLVQAQVMMGEDAGIYYFDDFDFTINNDYINSAVDGDWNAGTTWAGGTVPVATDNVQIDHAVTITTDETIDNIIVNNNAAETGYLQINNSSSLIVTGDLNVTGTNTNGVLLASATNSGASLIVEGTASGIGKYRRRTAMASSNGGTNDLISAPMEGATFQSVVNSSTLYQNGTTGVYLFGPFDNAANPGVYENYDTTLDGTTIIESGKGYRAGTDAGANVVFTGSILTDQVDISITDETGSYGSWNLIGNPYPSYLSFKDFFDLVSDATGTLAGANNKLDPTHTAVYGYDADDTDPTGSIWTIWDFNNVAYATDLIIPGQGFFVKAKAGAGAVLDDTQVSFTPTMRKIGTTDDFISGRMAETNLALAKLNLTNSNNSYATNIYFRDINTRGLDPGYDTGAYNQSGLGIYTHLVEDNTGVQMANQSLFYEDLNDVVVPLAINADQGVQISISLDDTSIIPISNFVYLEDNVTNTWTLLNSSDYTFTPSTTLSGTGRFFVHFSSTTLSVEQTEFNSLQIYMDQSSRLVNVRGQLNEETQVFIYDILGRKVLEQNLDNDTLINRVNVNTLHTGIYMVHLNNRVQTKTQKIIIR